MEYETLPEERCIFETHRKYVDLQYTISGGETIAWCSASKLKPNGPFDEVRDLQFYHRVESPSRVHMPAGYFAIFYPSDAHLPKISDGLHASVFKVVIKVGLHLLQQPPVLPGRLNLENPL